MEENPSIEAVSRPRGTFPTRVDEKGRLKLPTDVFRFLESRNAKRVFVTSMDEKTALIYPMPAWESVETLLNQPGDDSDRGRDTLLRAYCYGQETDIDSGGRLVIPVKTRRLLGLEDLDVQLLWMREHVQVFSGPVMEAMLKEASRNPQDDVRFFERKGMQ